MDQSLFEVSLKFSGANEVAVTGFTVPIGLMSNVMSGKVSRGNIMNAVPCERNRAGH